MEKIIETKVCKKCWAKFYITDKDLEFYNKVSPIFDWKKYTISTPTLCPGCRQQRRLAFRNERELYKRKCSSSWKDIISIYSPEKPYKVYDQDIWWSDIYNPLDYWKSFDFSKSFFNQFQELLNTVPLPNIQNSKSENCEYTNYSRSNKDCYLCVWSWESQDCYYSYRVVHCKSVVDSYDLYSCENCYECSSSKDLYHCLYSHNCHNCSYCFGCIDLYDKKYCIFNKQYTQDERENNIKNIQKEEIKGNLNKLVKNATKSILINTQNCRWNYLINCKDCFDSYILKWCEWCIYSKIWEHDKDCKDSNFFDNNELQYDSTNLQSNYKCAFGNLVRYTKNSYYLMTSFNSKNCFGCIWLKGNEYCILNKKYTKEEYNKLVPKIIEHMQNTWEWGEFFPIWLSPFAYNETVSGEWYPLEKDEIASFWYKRKDRDDKNYSWPIYKPLNTEEYSKIENQQEILNSILKCEITGKPYRIIKQELNFYIRMWIEIPTSHPDIRHIRRIKRSWIL